MDDLDPIRLSVAAHELGHMVTWEHAGFRIQTIRVTGRGTSTQGLVHVDRGLLRDPGEVRAWLVGLLAGREAEQRWCDQTGSAFIEAGSGEDLAQFRKWRRHEWARRLTERELRIEARQCIRTRWRQIVRLTPRLAHAGRL